MDCFGGRFAGAIKAEFEACAKLWGGVVEDIDGAAGEFDIASWVTEHAGVGEDLEGVVHVAIIVDNEDGFGPSHLACAPDAVHDTAALEWVGFLYADAGAVVERAELWEVVVFDVVNDCFEER